MSVRQAAIRGVFWSAVRTSGSTLVSALAFLVLARLLLPEAFGLVAYAAVFTNVLAILQRQGFSQAIVQRRTLEPGHLDAAFWTGTAIAVALAIATVIAAGPIAAALDQPALAPVVRALAAVLVLDALGSTPQALLRRRLAFRSLAGRSLAAAGVGGAIGVGLAIGGAGVWALVAQQIASSATGTVAMWWASGWTPGRRCGMRHVRDLVGFGVFAMGMEILSFLVRHVPDFLIGVFLGVEALGLYTLGARLVLMISRVLTGTVQAIALPTFSRIQHDPAQMRQAMLTATGMTTLVAFPAFAGLAVLAPDLVPVLFGSQWAGSVPILRLVAITGMLQSLTFFNFPIILACGRPAWAFMLALAKAMTAIAAFVLAVGGGIVWVAAAFAIHACLFAPAPVAVVRRLIGLPIGAFLAAAAPPLGAAAVMAGAVAVVQLARGNLPAPALLAIGTLIGAVVYVVALRIIAPRRLEQVTEYARLAVSSRNAQTSAPASEE